jgi:geranylgeranyl diphosphate synthase type 3
MAALVSPNAIPPRTSSTGLYNPQTHAPTKPVLQPLPEANWISPKRTSNGTTTAQNPTEIKTHIRAQSLSSAISPKTAAGIDPPRKNSWSGHESGVIKLNPQDTWTEEKERIVMGPYDYLFAHPGKDVRSQLIHAFDAWLQVPPKSLAIITSVVGQLHTASLLIDDVEDSSLLRRGLPVAHSLFGTAQTINTANYVYFRALAELCDLKNRDEAVRIYSEELVNLHRGQGMDLYWRDTLTVPTEEDYLEMVGNKTGGLFRLAVRLMQAESEHPRYVPFPRNHYP